MQIRIISKKDLINGKGKHFFFGHFSYELISVFYEL